MIELATRVSIMFDVLRTVAFFVCLSEWERYGTVRYGTVQYDIVLHVELNSSELTETLKTVKYSNMLKRRFFFAKFCEPVLYRTVPYQLPCTVQSNNFEFPNKPQLNFRWMYDNLKKNSTMNTLFIAKINKITVRYRTVPY